MKKTNDMNTNNSNKKNVRRITVGAAVILLLCLTATGAIAALAARWFDQSNKVNNTVTVDKPVMVSVGGDLSKGVIMPGIAGSEVTTEFDVLIEGESSFKYNLVIKDITFEFDKSLTGSEASIGFINDKAEFEAIFGVGYTDFSQIANAQAFADFLKEFKVSYNDVDMGDLYEGMVLEADAATASGLTVTIHATDDLLLIARGGTLTFTLALEIDMA